MKENVLILGGGVAGMQTALALSNIGIASTLIEKEPQLGGRVRNYEKLFPSFESGRRLVETLEQQLLTASFVDVRLQTKVACVDGQPAHFNVWVENHRDVLQANALVVATGFEPFDCSLQEEYGYGIYRNVISATELERFLDSSGPTAGEVRRPSDGGIPETIAIVFCVGSRSDRVGSKYCSRICCSFSTKHAIEIKEKYPQAKVTCFYIDIRTYGRGFEEMYRRAQEMGVTYIRGRVSECSELLNGDITIRAENTFLGRPLQGVFNLVSLSHGMRPSKDASHIAGMLGIAVAEDGFFQTRDMHLYPNDATRDGVFLAGSATGLKPVPDCIADGNSVAARVHEFLRRMDIKGDEHA